MARDPRKRITGVGVGMHRGKFHLILLLSEDDRLIIASNGLNEEQARLVCDGFVDGLRESSGLTEDMLTTFLEDPRAIAALQIPGDMSLAERELFKRGALGGMSVAAAGFWLDDTERVGDSRVLH